MTRTEYSKLAESIKGTGIKAKITRVGCGSDVQMMVESPQADWLRGVLLDRGFGVSLFGSGEGFKGFTVVRCP